MFNSSQFANKMLSSITVIVCFALITIANTISDKCFVPEHAGFCLALVRRYYLDSTAKKCELKKIGGCPDQAEGFMSLKECNQNCFETSPPFPDACIFPQELGRCKRSGAGYYLDFPPTKCVKKAWIGCPHKSKGFRTIEECNEMCFESRMGSKLDTCNLPADGGPCNAFHSRYFFNKAKMRCEKFVYGGCAGNHNNFLSEEDCKRMCDRFIAIATPY